LSNSTATYDMQSPKSKALRKEVTSGTRKRAGS
jgi:hypothetical protein